MGTMRAILTTKYGPPEVLRIQEVDRPVPRSHEMLIGMSRRDVKEEMSSLRYKDPDRMKIGGLQGPAQPLKTLRLQKYAAIFV